MCVKTAFRSDGDHAAEAGAAVRGSTGAILFPWIFYAYASEVRNDTGDAIFIFGTGPNV